MFLLQSRTNTTRNAAFHDSRKPIPIAFTVDEGKRSNSCSSCSCSEGLQKMIYYSLDPQFATLLFSVYARSERIGLSLMPDAFCFTASGVSSSSLISYAQSVGLQLIALGDYYSNLFAQGSYHKLL